MVSISESVEHWKVCGDKTVSLQLTVSRLRNFSLGIAYLAVLETALQKNQGAMTKEVVGTRPVNGQGPG